MNSHTHPEMLEGWLKKRGEKGLIKAPKLRYFLQSGTNLDYFVEKNTFSPQGSIDLKKIQNIVQKNATSFVLVSSTGRSYQLELASEAGSKDPPKPIEYWLNGFREWKMYFVTNDENSPIELKTAPILEKEPSSINRPHSSATSRRGGGLDLDHNNSPTSQSTNTNESKSFSNEISSFNPFASKPSNEPSPQHANFTTSKPQPSHQNQQPQSYTDLSQPQPVPPLWKLIKDGDQSKLKDYLTVSKIRLKEVQPFQMSPIHYAVMTGSNDTIKVLVINGCSPTVYDSAGQTPLLYAIEKHTGILSSTMVETLLNCGANPNEGDLVNDFSPLNAACLAGNEEIVRSLVIRGVNVNQEDKRLQWSPLHWAAAGGSFEIVKFLVKEKGIKWNKNKMPTPDMIASRSGFESIAKYLSSL